MGHRTCFFQQKSAGGSLWNAGMKRLSAERKKSCISCLLTTVSWLPLLYIRARRIGVHGTIRREKKCGEYYRLHQEKKRSHGDITSTFLKNWGIFNSEWLHNSHASFSLGGHLLPQMFAPHQEQLKLTLVLRKKCNVNTSPKSGIQTSAKCNNI